MSNLQLFNFDDNMGIKTDNTPEGETVMCAASMARAFGLKRANNAVARIAPEFKVVLSTDTPGGRQEMVYFREPGAYEFAATVRLRKSNPNYEKILRFRRWLYSEVLPSIFRTGGYRVGPTLGEKKAAFAEALEIARMLGYEGSEALIVANRGVLKNLGVDLMGEFRPMLPSPRNEAILTPTELGRRLANPISAQAANKRLAELGLQSREGGAWRLTEAGREFGQYFAVPKAYGEGTVQVIKWRESVAGQIEGVAA